MAGTTMPRNPSAAHLRHSTTTWLAQFPALYLPAARWKYRRALRALGPAADPDSVPPVVGPDTQVVIEGYPRSANSFAVAAFRLAQGRPIDIAHHRHVAAQVLGAIELGVPTLVLIRAPDEAVLSLAVRHPVIGVRGALVDYNRFYRPLVRHRGRVVWAEFSDVTTDFGRVVRRLNDHYGTSFVPFEHTPENVTKCFEAIERHDRATLGRGADTMGARPTDRRAPLKNELRPHYFSTELARLRRQADDLYATLTGTRSTR